MYVRSKQKRREVGPVEGSDGNIITEGLLMAENPNEYLSSVFTRDINVLPVPESKFEGRESDYLGQLFVFFIVFYVYIWTTSCLK